MANVNVKVEIYSGDYCPYCTRAKALLDQKGVVYDEIDVTKNPERREEMMKRAGGRRTIPQIFIDGVHIGGCDDMYALNSAGKLDPMLKLG